MRLRTAPSRRFGHLACFTALLLTAGCGSGASTPDVVAQHTPLPVTSPPVADVVAAAGVGANTCALDADPPEPGRPMPPNPARRKPSPADPHHGELVGAAKDRWLTASEREQHSSPAWHLAHDIADKVDYYDDVRNEGYADIRFDTSVDTVDLWWKGPLPRWVRKIVDAGPARHVVVQLHDAAYGRGYLLQHMNRVRQNAELDAAGIHWAGSSPALGASGIRIEISCRGLGANPTSGAALARKVFERQTGIRVTTVTVTAGEAMLS